jgi:hypothetical protein
MRFLPVVSLFLIGCGGPTPVAPEAEGQGAARVFALAQDLEGGRKTKQAIAAYRQVVDHFPNTPEARKAAERISEAQRAAIRQAAARNRKSK